jgi:hypothetical protein
MPRLLFILLYIGICPVLWAQSFDLISVRKKNGRIIKTFTAGSRIVFETRAGNYVEGLVEVIRNDSVLTRVYDIRPVMTAYGFTVADTISTSVVKLHYGDIKRIKVFERHRFIRGKMDRLLMYGGAGYFVLNVINPAIFGRPVTSKKNVRTLGLSAGAFAAGVIIKKYFYVNRFSRNRHKIVYIDVR